MSKSPFVSEHETRKYRYPQPWKDDEVDAFGDPLVDPEVFEDDDGTRLPEEKLPWIRVRIPRSRGDQDAIADHTQRIVMLGGNGDGVTTRQRIGEANRYVFELLVEEWSFSSEKPTADDYDRLNEWAGPWVVAVLGDANARGAKKASRAKPSSETPSGSPSESASESVPA